MGKTSEGDETDDDDDSLGATSNAKEKRQKKNCSFNQNRREDPIDLDMAALEIWRESGKITEAEMNYLKIIRQTPERPDESKERKMLRDKIKSFETKNEIEKTILSKIKFGIEREGFSSQRESPATENNMMKGSIRDIKVESQKKKGDSGFLSTKSHTCSATDRSLARAENDEPINKPAEEKQNEDPSCDGASNGAASKGQTANTSNTSNLSGSGNATVQMGSGSNFEFTVNLTSYTASPAKPVSRGATKKPPGTRK